MTTDKDFESQGPLNTSTVYAMKSSPDLTSDRHIVWGEMDTVLAALNLKVARKLAVNIVSLQSLKTKQENSQQHSKT